MIYAQWTLLVFQFANMLFLFYRDVNGVPAKEPKGFDGIIGTIISAGISFALMYSAGAYSLIF